MEGGREEGVGGVQVCWMTGCCPGGQGGGGQQVEGREGGGGEGQGRGGEGKSPHPLLHLVLMAECL